MPFSHAFLGAGFNLLIGFVVLFPIAPASRHILSQCFSGDCGEGFSVFAPKEYRYFLPLPRIHPCRLATSHNKVFASSSFAVFCLSFVSSSLSLRKRSFFCQQVTSGDEKKLGVKAMRTIDVIYRVNSIRAFGVSEKKSFLRHTERIGLPALRGRKLTAVNYFTFFPKHLLEFLGRSPRNGYLISVLVRGEFKCPTTRNVRWTGWRLERKHHLIKHRTCV